MSTRVVSAFAAALQLCFYLTALIVTSLATPPAGVDSPDGKRRSDQNKNNNNNNNTDDDEIFIRVEESRPELPDEEPETDSSGGKEEEPTNERQEEGEEEMKEKEEEEREEEMKEKEEEEVTEKEEEEKEEEEQDSWRESSEVREVSICEPAEVSTPRRSRSCSGVRVELKASEVCEYTVKESDDGYLVVSLRATKCRHTKAPGTHSANQTGSSSPTSQGERVDTAASQECHDNATETTDAPECLCAEDSSIVPPSGQLETDSSLSQPGFENLLPSDLGNSKTSPEGSLPEDPRPNDIFREKANLEESCCADSSQKGCFSANQNPEDSCSRIPHPEEPCPENTFLKDASSASACPDDSLQDALSRETSSPVAAPCLDGPSVGAPSPKNLLQEESPASQAQCKKPPGVGKAPCTGVSVVVWYPGAPTTPSLGFGRAGVERARGRRVPRWWYIHVLHRFTPRRLKWTPSHANPRELLVTSPRSPMPSRPFTRESLHLCSCLPDKCVYALGASLKYEWYCFDLRVDFCLSLAHTSEHSKLSKRLYVEPKYLINRLAFNCRPDFPRQ